MLKECSGGCGSTSGMPTVHHGVPHLLKPDKHGSGLDSGQAKRFLYPSTRQLTYSHSKPYNMAIAATHTMFVRSHVVSRRNNQGNNDFFWGAHELFKRILNYQSSNQMEADTLIQKEHTHSNVAMGQNPNRIPAKIPNPTTKIRLKWVVEVSCIRDLHSLVSNITSKSRTRLIT